MPHSITCGACKASFSIPDDVWEKRVQGQIATLKCRQCKAPIQVDGRTRKGSPAAGATNVSAPIEPTEPTQVTAPANIPKQAPALQAPVTEAKPAEAKPQAKVDEAPKKVEVKATSPQAVKSVLEKPKSTGLQPSRLEFKQPEAKPSTTSKTNVDVHPKPAADARATASAPKPQATGAVSYAADASAQTRKATFGSAAASTMAAKPAIVGTAKSKAAMPAPAVADAKPSPSDNKTDEDLSELWVVSFAVDDDRELHTAQVLEHIAQGQLNADTIVWREGMADWLPISQVPQLAHALKPQSAPIAEAASVKAAPNVHQDDGEDETVIYRPGSKAAAFMESPTVSAAASRAGAVAGVSGAEKPIDTASKNPQLGTARTPSLDKQDPGQRPTGVGPAARPPAHPTTGATRVEPSPAKADPFDSKESPLPAKAAGGPPPLRRQPSKPDEPLRHERTKSHDEVVTSVREFTPVAAPARAAAPPPLPAAEKKELPKEATAAKPAMFPPAVQTASTAQVAQPFAPVANPPSLPPTPSFAPRPSDIAALTKIRPKFPKWLPFAVLGGLVVLVAILAAMSWFRGDNIESKEQKAPVDNALPPSATATKPGTSPSVAPTSTAAVDKKPASDGFANSFAQAVAKQRPTGKFDREAAEKALAPAFAKAAGCHNKGEPTGTANLTISISPSGQVLSVTIAPPFTTTFTAECIRNALRDASMPPFQGSPGRLAHSLAIR